MGFSLDLDASAGSLRALRNGLRGWLRKVGVTGTDEQDEIVLACWEAAANAVEHPVRGSGEVRVRAERRGDRIHVCVADTGTWRARDAPRAEGGLGLRLIGALMDRVELVRTPHGTQVLMCRALDHRSLGGHGRSR